MGNRGKGDACESALFTELFLIRGYLPLFPTGILYYTKAGLSQKLGTVPLLL